MGQWVSVKIAYATFAVSEAGWVWETQARILEKDALWNTSSIVLTPPNPTSPEERGRKRKM